MKYREEVSKELNLKPVITGIYIRAFWYSVRMSFLHFTPVFVYGLCDFVIHKWIFKLKVWGKDLPMPQGINEALRENEVKTYNYRRRVGTALKYTVDDLIYLGIVKKQIGEDRLAVEQKIALKQVRWRGTVRYKMTELTPRVVLLDKNNYKPVGSVYYWVKKNVHRIDPVISLEHITRILKIA